MSATDELRRMLDERGVEYESISDTCTYVGETQLTEYEPGIVGLQMRNLTPEQAIAATLGGSTLTAHDVWEAIGNHGVSQLQAIADELNAVMGGGECEAYRDEYGVWHCSSCEKGADKITGSDGALESWNDSWPPNFCPMCGARIRKVVEW